MATIFKQLTNNDIFTDTTKLTAGIFASGAGQLAGTAVYTASISSSNDSYYYTIQDKVNSDASAVSYFDVFFGSFNNYGSSGGTNDLRETETIYKQFANILLDDPYAKFQFTDISGSNSFVEEEIFGLVVKTDKMKDRVHTKFTLELSGSITGSGAAGAIAGVGLPHTLVLTNYTSSRFPSIAGDYYYVVSGSGGAINKGTSAATPGAGGHLAWDQVYGHFYPNLGTIVLSGTQLSASIPGPTGSSNVLGGLTSGSQYEDANWGFAVDRRTDGNADNKMKLVKSLQSGSVTLRSEQDLNQTTYYCRMYHNEFNFSSNPTFIQSGSTLGDILEDMQGDPTVYVSGIGLYNTFGELIAVAKLNIPQKKNFNKELTIAAKLDG
jgi:hypothetical protein